jgi:hypothetical protein
MHEEATEDERIALRLELDRDAEPISGRLTGPEGVGAEFVGWLALSAALERLVKSKRKGDVR